MFGAECACPSPQNFFPNKSTYLLLLFSAKVTNYTLIYVIYDMVLR